jgi:hypothetical protein
MTTLRSMHDSPRDADIGRQERRQLDLALQDAHVGTDDLDRARGILLDRLSRHADDFAATTALQALNRFDAGAVVDAQSAAPARVRDAVRNAGLSAVQRIRGARAGTRS